MESSAGGVAGGDDGGDVAARGEDVSVANDRTAMGTNEAPSSREYVVAEEDTASPSEGPALARPSMRRGAKCPPAAPRIDQGAQLDEDSIPSCEAPPLNSKKRLSSSKPEPPSGGSQLVWSASTWVERETSRLVALCRQALVQSRYAPRPSSSERSAAKRARHPASPSSEVSEDEADVQAKTINWRGGYVPLEADEVLLAHLQKLGGDAAQCEYSMISVLGAASEATARQRHRTQRRAVLRAANAGAVSLSAVGSSGVLAAAIYDPARPPSRETQLYAPIPGHMGGNGHHHYLHKGGGGGGGGFYHGVGARYAFDDDGRLDRIWAAAPPPPNNEDAVEAAAPVPADAAVPESPRGGGATTTTTGDEELEPRQRKLDRRGRGLGRADAKARWRDLELRARVLLSSSGTENHNNGTNGERSSRRGGATLAECLEVLREAESLPQSFAEVCAQADGAASLRAALVDVRQEVDAVRALSARARDCACRGSSVVFSRGYNALGLAYQGSKFHQRLAEAEEDLLSDKEVSLSSEVGATDAPSPVPETDPAKDAEDVLRGLESSRIFDEAAHAGLSATLAAGHSWTARARAVCGASGTRRKAPSPSNAGPAPTPTELAALAIAGAATPFVDGDLVKRVETLAEWTASFDRTARDALAARPRNAAVYKTLFDLRRKLARGVGKSAADSVALETRRELDDVCGRAETWLGDSTRVVAEPRRATLAALRRLVSAGTALNVDATLLSKLVALADKSIAWTRAAAKVLGGGVAPSDDTLGDLHHQAIALSLPPIARRAVARERALRQWRLEARALLSACLDAPPRTVDDSDDDLHKNNNSTTTTTTTTTLPSKAAPAAKSYSKAPSMAKVRRHLEALDASDDDDYSNDDGGALGLRKANNARDAEARRLATYDPEIDASLAAIAAASAARALEPPSAQAVELRRLLGGADAWAARAKVAAKADGAEASLGLLVQLIEEGRNLRVEVSPLVRPLVALQKRVVVWLDSTKTARRALALLDTTPANLVASISTDGDAVDDDDGPVGLDQVSVVAGKAKRIAVSVDEIAQMRMFAARARAWRGRHRELCGNFSSPPSGGPAANPDNVPLKTTASSKTASAATSSSSSSKGTAAAQVQSTTATSLSRLDAAFATLSRFVDVDSERRGIVDRGDAVKESLAVASDLVATVGLSAAASQAAFDADRRLPDDATDRLDLLKKALDETASSVACAKLQASLRLNRWCARVRSIASPLDANDNPAARGALGADDLAACRDDRDRVRVDDVGEVWHERVFEKWSLVFDDLSTRYGALHSWQRRCFDLAHSKRPTMDDLRAAIKDAPRYLATTTTTPDAPGPTTTTTHGEGDDDLTTIKKRLEWLEAAELALRGMGQKKKLDLRAIEGLAKRAAPIRLSDCDDAKLLRAEARKARDWLGAVKRTGIERGEASIAELRKLVAAVRTIRVDLSDDVDVLVQASRATCVCAAPADGQMLDCPSCHVSFHASCLFFAEDAAPATSSVDASILSTSSSSVSQSQSAAAAAPASLPPPPTTTTVLSSSSSSAAAAAAAVVVADGVAATSMLDASSSSVGQPLPKRRRVATAAAAENSASDPTTGAHKTRVRARDDANRKRKGASAIPQKKALDVERCPRCQLRRCAAAEARAAAELLKLIRRDDGTPLGHAAPGSPAAAALVSAAQAFGAVTEESVDGVSAQSSMGSDHGDVTHGIAKLESAAAALSKSAHQNDHARRRLLTSLRRLAYAYRVGCLLQKSPRVSTIDALIAQPVDESFGEAEFRRTITKHLSACATGARDLVKQLRICIAATTPRDPRTKAKKERRVDVSKVKAILDQARRIPVRLGKLRRQCDAIIEDGGRRYCICRGPSDGSFMLGCDRCDEWFHGRCVGISENDDVGSYECQSCRDKQVQQKQQQQQQGVVVVAEGNHDADTEQHQRVDLQLSSEQQGPLQQQPPKSLLSPVMAPAALSGVGSGEAQQQQRSEDSMPAARPRVPAPPDANVAASQVDVDSLSDSSDNDNAHQLVCEHPLPWSPVLLLKDDVPAATHSTKRLRIDTSAHDADSFASRMHQLGSVLPATLIGSPLTSALSPPTHPFLLDAHRQYMLPFSPATSPAGQSIEPRLYETDLARMHMLAPPRIPGLPPFQGNLCAPSPRDANPSFVPPMMSHMQMSPQQLQVPPPAPPLRQDLQQQQLLFHQRLLQQQQQRPPLSQQRSSQMQQQHMHQHQQHQQQVQQFIQQQQQQQHQLQQQQHQQQQHQQQQLQQQQLHQQQHQHQQQQHQQQQLQQQQHQHQHQQQQLQQQQHQHLQQQQQQQQLQQQQHKHQQQQLQQQQHHHHQHQQQQLHQHAPPPQDQPHRHQHAEERESQSRHHDEAKPATNDKQVKTKPAVPQPILLPPQQKPLPLPLQRQSPPPMDSGLSLPLQRVPPAPPQAPLHAFAETAEAPSQITLLTETHGQQSSERQLPPESEDQSRRAANA